MPNPVQEGNLIFTDPPRHRQLRKLINSGFTRRQVALLEPKMREIVRGILDDIEPDSVHEFAEEIAAPLPTRMIAELLGAPPDDWEQFRAWSDAAVGTADPDIELDTFVALGELYEYFKKLIARQAHRSPGQTTCCRSWPAPRSTASGSPTRTCSTSPSCCWSPATRPPAT